MYDHVVCRAVVHLCYLLSSILTDYSSHVPQFKTSICSIEVNIIQYYLIDLTNCSCMYIEIKVFLL